MLMVGGCDYWQVRSIFICPRDVVQKWIPLFLTPRTEVQKMIVEDKEGHFQKVLNEQVVRIQRILLDYDKPHDHLIDGVKVLSTVLSVWKWYRPNFDNDYTVSDIEIPRILFRFCQCLKVPEKDLSTELLSLLMGYDDQKFADQVIIGVVDVWKRILRDIEHDCLGVESATEDEPHMLPPAVIIKLRDYGTVIKG